MVLGLLITGIFAGVAAVAMALWMGFTWWAALLLYGAGGTAGMLAAVLIVAWRCRCKPASAVRPDLAKDTLSQEV